MVSAEKNMFCLIHLCNVKPVQAIRSKLNTHTVIVGLASPVVDSSKRIIIKQYRSVCHILIFEISGSSGHPNKRIRSASCGDRIKDEILVE